MQWHWAHCSPQLQKRPQALAAPTLLNFYWKQARTALAGSEVSGWRALSADLWPPNPASSTEQGPPALQH